MIINYKLKPLVAAVALVFSMQTQADDMINAGNHNPSSSTDNNGSGVLMNSDPCAHNKRNIGITVGAIAGAIIGNIASKNKHKALGIILGGVAGAGLGGFIGSELDNRQCELSKFKKDMMQIFKQRLLKSVRQTQRQFKLMSLQLPTIPSLVCRLM